MSIDYLGWAATLVFGASYFWKRADVLRAVQMAGAMMWVLYGLLIQAPPVVAANLFVLAAAAWTMRRRFVPRHGSGRSARLPCADAVRQSRDDCPEGASLPR